MQVLSIKKRNKEGKEVMVAVHVLRSWQDGSGKQVYLHSNGVYGYKDGTPVRTLAELTDTIGSPVQRDMAVAWWKAGGKELSAKYYADRSAAERAAAADFNPAVKESDTTLDQAMYQWRERDVKGAKWQGPVAWMDRFPRRPDWWGQADTITLAGIEYQRVAGPSGGTLSPAEV